MTLEKSDVTSFLTSYATALSKGDVGAIAAAWHIPSLVLGPDKTIAVSTSAEVESFFRASIDDYGEKGIYGARLATANITCVSVSVATAEVTWKHLNAQGQSVGEERAFYVISKSTRPGNLGIDLYSPVDGI